MGDDKLYDNVRLIIIIFVHLSVHTQATEK